MIRRPRPVIWTYHYLISPINRLKVPLTQVHYLDALYIFLGIIEAIRLLSLSHSHDWITIARSAVVLNGPVLKSELEGVRSFGFGRLFNETVFRSNGYQGTLPGVCLWFLQGGGVVPGAGLPLVSL